MQHIKATRISESNYKESGKFVFKQDIYYKWSKEGETTPLDKSDDVFVTLCKHAEKVIQADIPRLLSHRRTLSFVPPWGTGYAFAFGAEFGGVKYTCNWSI